MPASLEVTAGIIRFGAGHSGNPSPYSGSVFLDPEGSVAHLKGASGVLSQADVRDIAILLLSLGFVRMRWQRYKAGQWKDVSVDLKRYMR